MYFQQNMRLAVPPSKALTKIVRHFTAHAYLIYLLILRTDYNVLSGGSELRRLFSVCCVRRAQGLWTNFFSEMAVVAA
jgi:hypothetical protein